MSVPIKSYLAHAAEGRRRGRWAFVFTVLAKAAIPIELGRSRLRPPPGTPR